MNVFQTQLAESKCETQEMAQKIIMDKKVESAVERLYNIQQKKKKNPNQFGTLI